MTTIMANAHHLHGRLLDTGQFEPAGDGRLFPVVTLHARDPQALDLFALSKRLRQRGWIVPAYPLPPNAQDLTVLRVVAKPIRRHSINWSRAPLVLQQADAPALRPPVERIKATSA